MKETPNPAGHYTIEMFKAETGTSDVSGMKYRPKKKIETVVETVVDNDSDTAVLAMEFKKKMTLILHVPKPVHTLLKRRAARSRRPLREEAEYGLCYWVKYLGQIEKSQSDEEDIAAIEKEITEAERLLHHLKVQHVLRQLKKKGIQGKGNYEKYSRRAWTRYNPGKLWPGASITNQVPVA